MFGRKILGLALAVIVVAAFTVQPADAGLGGCFGYSCHGPQSAPVPVGKSGSASGPLFNSLRWFLPTHVVTFLQGAWNGGAKVQGLGGCFTGLGGCKL